MAVSPTPTSKPTAQASPTIVPTSTTLIEKLKKIETLKEKIATKVAQLREEEKGAMYGSVKKIDKTSVTISTAKNDQTVSFLDDAVFYTFKNDKREEIKASAVKEKDTVTIFGYFDQSKTNFSAKYVYIEDSPIHLRGKITDTDKTNYTITVREKQGNTVVDVETYSKTVSFDRTKKNFISAGFSKMKIGDTVHVIATPNPKTENRVSAKRIYLFSFPNQPTNAVTTAITVTPNPKTATSLATPSKKN